MRQTRPCVLGQYIQLQLKKLLPIHCEIAHKHWWIFLWVAIYKHFTLWWPLWNKQELIFVAMPLLLTGAMTLACACRFVQPSTSKMIINCLWWLLSANVAQNFTILANARFRFSTYPNGGEKNPDWKYFINHKIPFSDVCSPFLIYRESSKYEFILTRHLQIKGVSLRVKEPKNRIPTREGHSTFKTQGRTRHLHKEFTRQTVN